MLLIEISRRDAFQADPARLSGLLSVYMATCTGIEPVISCVTGKHLKPLD